MNNDLNKFRPIDLGPELTTGLRNSTPVLMSDKFPKVPPITVDEAIEILESMLEVSTHD